MGHVLVAVLGHPDAVLDTHAANFGLELADLLTVQVAQVELIEVSRHLTIEQEVAEVAARLDRDHVASFNDTATSHVADTGQGTALRRVW